MHNNNGTISHRNDITITMHTREKILFEASKLFAIKGFAAVSMRDIAQTVGIKPPSIYNYYDGKNDLLYEILLRFKKEYNNYFVWLNSINSKANSLEEVVHNMFIQLKDVRELFIYYGIAIVLKEQFHNEYARKIAFQIFYKDSVKHLKSAFDTLIEKKLIEPCDTNTIATFFMYNVLIGNELRIHEVMNHDLPVDCVEMYSSLEGLLLAILKNGIPSA